MGIFLHQIAILLLLSLLPLPPKPLSASVRQPLTYPSCLGFNALPTTPHQLPIFPNSKKPSSRDKKTQASPGWKHWLVAEFGGNGNLEYKEQKSKCMHWNKLLPIAYPLLLGGLGGIVNGLRGIVGCPQIEEALFYLKTPTTSPNPLTIATRHPETCRFSLEKDFF